MAYSARMPADAAPASSGSVGRNTKIALGAGLVLVVVNLVCLATMAPGHGRLVLFASVVVAFAALGVALLRRAGIRRPTLLVFAASAILVALYLSATGFDERNYDAAAHLQYIHKIADEHVVPVSQDCSICHHPPLYHLLAAVVMIVAERTQVVSAAFALQVFSVGLFFVFLGFGTLTVERLTTSARAQPWAAAFLAFWPVSTINAVRLNNDLLEFALMAAGLYYLVRWRREGSRALLIVACLVAVAATGTKLNGFILCAAIAGLLVWDLIRTGEPRLRARRDAPVVGGLAAVLAIMVGVRMWREPGSFSQRALGSAADPSGTVAGPFWDYLRLDFGRYFASPFSVADKPGYGAPYWNHVFKSSLFGTRGVFQWGDGETFVSSNALAHVAGGLLLLLVAYMMFAAVFLRRVPTDHRALSPYLVVCFFCAGLAFHIWSPKPHHTDFRFVFPVLIPIAAGFFEATEAVRRRRQVAGLVGHGLLIVFWLVSIAFFAVGVRPSVKRLAERVYPGPQSEEVQPNRLPRLHFLRPRFRTESR